MIGVFGGSGFIGRNLINQMSANDVSFKIFSRRLVPGFNDSTIQIDFEDPNTYREHLAGLTSVVLLVSASVPGTYMDDLPSEIERNVLPYARFMRAIQSTTIRHIVYLSSGGAVYGNPQASLIDEAHPTNPINPYGCGKLMIEELIKSAAAKSPWTYTILRPSNPIGPFQSSDKGQGLVPKLIQAGLTGNTIEVWGDGSSVRDYFDVRDLCRAMTLVIDEPRAKNTTYNVSSAIGLSILDIVKIVELSLNKKIKLSYNNKRQSDVSINVLSNKRICDIGWRRMRDIKSSILDMLRERDRNKTLGDK